MTPSLVVVVAAEPRRVGILLHARAQHRVEGERRSRSHLRSSPRGARFFVSPSSSRRHGRSIVPHYVCSPQALGPPGFMFFRKFSRLCKQRKFQARCRRDAAEISPRYRRDDDIGRGAHVDASQVCLSLWDYHMPVVMHAVPRGDKIKLLVVATQARLSRAMPRF